MKRNSRLRGRVKFVALLVLLMGTFNALGVVILETIPKGTDIRLVADYLVPIGSGFGSVYLTYLIADRERWL